MVSVGAPRTSCELISVVKLDTQSSFLLATIKILLVIRGIKMCRIQYGVRQFLLRLVGFRRCGEQFRVLLVVT
jgi:hypothetical protein